MVSIARSGEPILADSSVKKGGTGATAQSAFSTPTTKNDPYTYQVGFGNSFASEAMYAFRIRVRNFLTNCSTHISPGVLPVGQNSPQKNKYGLYAEGVGIDKTFNKTMN